MSSNRLPGKVLADIGGEPMLALLLRRLDRSVEVSSITVATSDREEDAPIAVVAQDAGAHVFRGSLDDVLGRLIGAAGRQAHAVARVTADCPLIDAAGLDEVVRRFRAVEDCDYASNVDPRVVPDGCDVEVISMRALRRIAASVTDAEVREHVTPSLRSGLDDWIYAPPLEPIDPVLPSLRWTVDEQADLDFVREVVKRLGPDRYCADIEQIHAVIREVPPLEYFGGHQRS